MRIGSLFSGYGGLDMAVQDVLGGEVVWYSEIDRHACQVLAAHHPGVPNLGDITTVDWSEVPPVDVLTGGYPCQPFSHAGKRKGKADERHLWPYVCAAIDALRPGLVVLENVRGHLTLGFGDVLADLSRVGYDARWGVVRASDAGAPHGRARIFIAAHSHGTGLEGHGDPPGTAQTGRHGHPVAGADVPPADADRDGHGVELHARRVGGVEAGTEGRTPQRQRARGIADAGGAGAAADADGAGGEAWGDTGRERERVRVEPLGPADVDWGKYEAAIRRWELLTRPAPTPILPGKSRGRLNPAFVEWMMGLPEGHVTGHGLRPAACLKMLGNGVVPQQAALALRMLGVAS